MVIVVFWVSKLRNSTPCTPSITVGEYELPLTAISKSSSSSSGTAFSPRSLGDALTLGVVPFSGSTLTVGIGTSLAPGAALGWLLEDGRLLAPGAALALGDGVVLPPGVTLGAVLALGFCVSPPRLRYVLMSHAPVAPRSALVNPFTLLHSGEIMEALSFFLLKLQQQ